MIRKTAIILCVLAQAVVTSAQTDYNARRLENLSPTARRRLENFTALGDVSITEIEQATDAERFERKVREILSVAGGNLAIGAREVDEDGRSPIHHYLLEQIQAMEDHGVEYVGSLKGRVAVPVSLHRLRDPDKREPHATLTVGQDSWKILPLWPNGAMPPLCPEGGLEGPLVDVGRGDWEDIKGLELDGAIAVMNFAGGRRWERLMTLGVQAVVVVEDGRVNRENAEGLFCNTPIPMPRFYVDAETGAEIRQNAARVVYRQGDEPEMLPGLTGRLAGGSTFEDRTFEAIFAYLPPTEPVRYEVRRDDLLNRIATEFGVSGSRLMRDNGLDSPDLSDVDKPLLIPNRDEPYSIREDDLLRRIAADYAMSADELAEANDITDRRLRPGLVLTIPNTDETVMIQVPIDSVSVVPDAPHGTQVATNLALALTAMEHLASSESVVRRKGVLFAFLDGENTGGMSSRTFAEYVSLEQDELRSTFVESPEDIIARYEGVVAWLEDPERSSLDDDVARWFGNEWLPSHLEDARVLMAETRVEIIKRQQALERQLSEDLAELKERDPEQFREIHDRQYATLQRVINRYQEWMDFLSGIRRQTLRQGGWSWSRRVEEFWKQLGEEEHRDYFQHYGVTREDFAGRVRQELAEEAELHAYHRNNTEVIPKLLDRINPDESRTPALAWIYDLSQGSRSLGMNKGNQFRGFGPAGGDNAGRLADRFSDVMGFASVQAGWDEQWAWLKDEDRGEFPMVEPQSAPHYSEFWMSGNVAVLPVSTYNDRRELLDTPHDTPEHTDFDNLAVQARTMLLLTKLGVENPTDSLPPESINVPSYGRVFGATTQFNIRSGISATAPVPNSWVYYPAIKSTAGWEAGARNTSTFRGSRRGVLRITLLSGAYRLPLEAVDFGRRHGETVVRAYRLNRHRALFDKALNHGRIGTQTQAQSFGLQSGEDAEHNIIMADVYPWVFAPGPDPQDYTAIGGGDTQLRVMDAVRDGEPRHYSMDNPGLQYKEGDVDSTIIYMAYDERDLGEGLPGLEDIPGFDVGDYRPERRRARVLARRSINYQMMLVGELPEAATEGERARSAQDIKGQGYLVGPEDDDRNLVLPLAPLRIAEDMYSEARFRYDLYEHFGIHDTALNDALERSKVKIDGAHEAVERRDWQAAVGLSREAWGILVKNLPRVLTLGREAVFSAVILMGLLVPAAAFLERLVIGGKGIIARLVGTAVIFVLGVVFMRFFHPAFEIAVSPFIVMIAFTMILIAVVVLVLSYQRFEVLVRRARFAAGEVEGDEMTFMGSIGTALSLGVSNLKKRPARTFLTVFTVTVLTFSIITFVSVRGEDEMQVRPLELDRDVAGARVEPQEPKYEGILFRNFFWTELPETFISAVYSEFGPRHEMTTRGYYLEVEGGNNMDREGVNQITVRRDDEMHIVTGIMTFMPNEPRFSGLNEAVSNQEWFRGEDRSTGEEAERFSVILPDNCAEALGITPEMLYDEQGDRLPDEELPQVLMRNRQWRVIGILDTEHANRIRDISGKSLSMVDYRRSAITASAGSGDIINERTLYHMDWDRLAIVPHAAADEVEAKPRAAVVRFGEDMDEEEFYKDLALRTNRTVFGTREGRPSLISARQVSTVGGLAKLIVPVLLCILIVLNTMLANVEERKGEVGMLGAIGLSPKQISFLLLSESSVFSVLGIVFGTFAGLLFANVVGWVQNVHPEFLMGLSLNFTSLSALGLAMLTGVVVLLATLLPANKAARLAAPSGMGKWELPEPTEHRIHFDLPFTLTRGNAVGMMAFFRRFLLNHTEAASPGFNCRNIEIDMLRGEEDALRIRADMWLSPYDLDVAQKMELKIVPTENEGVFGVRLNLDRFSGTEDAWLRTNYGFMDLVRHQFLLWRNLDNDTRMNYITEGAELFQEQQSQTQESR